MSKSKPVKPQKGKGEEIDLSDAEEKALDKIWDEIGQKNPPPYAKNLNKNKKK